MLSGHAGEIKLSFKEAELLKLLYYCRTNLLTVAKYLACYGVMLTSLIAATPTFITKLRGYFKGDLSVELLTVVKGVGYRIVIEQNSRQV